MRPVPGHCVCFFACGKSPRAADAVNVSSSFGAVRIVQVEMARRAVDARHVLRSAARREILQVDHVSHVEEVVGPSWTAVRRLQPVDAGLPGAVEEDDGYGDRICFGTITSTYMAPPIVDSLFGPSSPTYLPPA